MIDWLNNWLKDIILIVLFAAFVDMLLPSTSIQKYAKMILGLLIILTIISPILSLFSNDFTVANLVNGFEEESLIKETITYDYDEVEANQEYEKKMIKEVEANMLNELNSLVNNKYDIFVTKLLLDANIVNQEWVINQLFITVSLKTVNNSTSSEIEEIQGIEDISINIDQKKKDEEKVNDNLDLINNLKELVHNEWGLDKEIILIDVISE